MSGGEESAERAILTDFGIAKLVTGRTGLTKTGVLGTLDYIAPEQIRASKEVDGRADLYALGVMIYQMLTGELPFEADNPGAVLIAHLQQPAPDPRAVVPDLNPGLSFVVKRALEKEPQARYETGAALIQALQDAVGR
jgi:serine/threonine-protein kinase